MTKSLDLRNIAAIFIGIGVLLRIIIKFFIPSMPYFWMLIPMLIAFILLLVDERSRKLTVIFTLIFLPLTIMIYLVINALFASS